MLSELKKRNNKNMFYSKNKICFAFCFGFCNLIQLKAIISYEKALNSSYLKKSKMFYSFQNTNSCFVGKIMG